MMARMPARPLPDRPPTAGVRPRVLVAAAAVAVSALAVFAFRYQSPELIDLEVYRSAARRVLDGVPLYPPGSRYADGQPFPFTYPPFAALLLTPLAWFDPGSAAVLWRLVTFAALVLLVHDGFAPLFRPLSRAGRAGAVALTALAALLLAPVFWTFALGQVGLVLSAACLIGLRRGEAGYRDGAVLIGLASAIKLTPAVFVLLLVAARRWRAAALAALTVAAAFAITAVLLPRDTRAWSAVFLDPDRVGPVDSPINLAWAGLAARTFDPSPGATALWLGLALATIAVAVVRGGRLLRAGQVTASATVVGLASVLASPIGWLHHAVWVVPALGVLVGTGRSGRRWLSALAVGAVVSLPGMRRLVPPGTSDILGAPDWLLVHAPTLTLAILVLTLRPERVIRPVDEVPVAEW